MPEKIRLDQLMVQQGLAESRSRAQQLVKQGAVTDAQERVLTKPGTLLAEDSLLTLQQDALPWVSRGGLKLAHALEHFSIDPAGAVVADIGASTGGFVDVLLQANAAHVYAIDVGKGQLHPKLQADDRVTVLDETNARYLDDSQLPVPLDAVVCDASFISLKLVLPASLQYVKPGGWLVALIKPQFEVGKERLGKNAVVTDPALHEEVCTDIAEWLDNQAGWQVQGITESPVTGPKGNKEFLLYAVSS